MAAATVPSKRLAQRYRMRPSDRSNPATTAGRGGAGVVKG